MKYVLIVHLFELVVVDENMYIFYKNWGQVKQKKFWFRIKLKWTIIWNGGSSNAWHKLYALFQQNKSGELPFSLKKSWHKFTDTNTLLTIFRILNHKSTGEAGRKAWMKCTLESMTNSCMPGRLNLFKVLTYLLQVLLILQQPPASF